MKFQINNRVKTLVLSIVALSVLGLIFLPTQQTQKAAQKADGGVTVGVTSEANPSASKQAYINRVSEGLSEGQLISANLNPTTKVNSMANLMELRSGLEMSPLVREKLSAMETVAFSGKEGLVSFDKLVDTLTDTTLDQLGRLTDENILQVIKTARGFNNPEIVEKVKNQPLGVFPGYYIDVSDKEAFNQIKASASPSAQVIIKAQIRSKIREQAGKALADFALASPATFGENWDSSAKQPSKGLTPSQAMLLSYTIVSGDSFADSTSSLASTMEKKHQALAKRYGSYPSAVGENAYGVNGYLFSSAFSLFFNEESQMALLQKLSSN